MKPQERRLERLEQAANAAQEGGGILLATNAAELAAALATMQARPGRWLLLNLSGERPA